MPYFLDIKPITKPILSNYITDSKWLDILWLYLGQPSAEDPLINNASWIFNEIAKSKKNTSKQVYPSSSECFNAFNFCKYSNLKVVILGQDPYHTPGVADGLAFSSKIPTNIPPSLYNIFVEIEDDVYNGQLILDQQPCLKHWAEQGILLLNTSLTVLEGTPQSHIHLWNDFTKHIVEYLNLWNPGLVFLLWGNHAKAYQTLIDSDRHYILTSGHPSPLSANRGLWFGNKHFSTVNKILHNNNGKDATVKWFN